MKALFANGEQLSVIFASLRQRWLDYYRNLAVREQRLLQLLLIFIPLFIAVYGIYLPMQEALATARNNAAHLQTEVLEAESLSAIILRDVNSNLAGSNASDALTVVEQAAIKAGVRGHIQRMRPQTTLAGEKVVDIRMKNAPYEGVLRFLDALAKAGLVVNEAEITKQDTPSFTDIRLQVRG
ncbi:MAG: type II secretion system protein GspM [Mariprofundales bacterium]